MEHRVQTNSGVYTRLSPLYLTADMEVIVIGYLVYAFQYLRPNEVPARSTSWCGLQAKVADHHATDASPGRDDAPQDPPEFIFTMVYLNWHLFVGQTESILYGGSLGS